MRPYDNRFQGGGRVPRHAGVVLFLVAAALAGCQSPSATSSKGTPSAAPAHSDAAKTPSALDWLTQAQDQMRQGRYNQALDACNHALALEPDNATCLSLRVEALIALKLWAPALQDVNTLLHQDDSRAEYYLRRGQIALNMHQLTAATQDVDRALELNPQLPPAWCVRSLLAYYNGQTDHAEFCLNQALQIAPGDIGVLRAAVNYHTTTRQLDKALGYATRLTVILPQDADVWLQRSVILMDLHRMQEAYQDLLQAAKLAPQTLPVLNGLAKWYVEANQLDQAQRTVQAMEQISPHNPEALLIMAAVQAKKGNDVLAVDCYTQYLRVRPSWDNYCRRANILNRLHMTKEAEADYALALQGSPNSPVVLNERGRARVQAGRLDEAQADFDQAIQKDPNWWGPYLERSALRVQRGDLAQALQDANQAVRLKPDAAPCWMQRAIVQRALGKNAEAMADLSQAIILNNRDPVLYDLRAQTALDLRLYDQALADYTKILEFIPNNQIAMEMRCRIFREKNDWARTIQEADKVLQHYPQSIAGLGNRGWACLQLHKYEEALPDLIKCVGLAPQNGEAWNNCGVAYENLKHYDEAWHDYTRATELSPELSSPYFGRAFILMQRKDFPGAVVQMDQLISIHPELGDAYRRRAFYAACCGRYDQAWADVDQATKLGVPLDDAFLSRLRQASGRDH